MKMHVKAKLSIRKSLKFSFRSAIALILSLTLLSTVVWAQPSPLPDLSLNQQFKRYFDNALNGQVEMGNVRLDGYVLFAIAAPSISNSPSQPDHKSSVEQRIQQIEKTLNQIANSDFNPDTLSVTSAIDSGSDSPIISVNGQYLMTVTNLDAQLQATEPKIWANQLTGIIKAALITAKQERQPKFLIRQAGMAAAIFLAMILVSTAIAAAQKHFRRQQKKLEAETPQALDLTSDTSSPVTVLTVHLQLKKRLQRNLSDIKRRLLLMGQVVTWGGGALLILGLFPQIRWLQPVVLSTPLRLIGLGLGIYLLVRVCDVAIDRFFEIIQRNELAIAQTTQRLSLRVSTLSRVLKNIVAGLWITVGLLISLSLIGVNLVPLLAGAGVVGLAISFATQSVIKDMINGFLILLEDQYALGDVIEVGAVSGLVENMNLRITQIRNSEGRLITIPNSEIRVVQNLSKDWSRVDLAVSIAYGTKPDQALQVLQKLSKEMYEDANWRTKLIEPPEVLGIDEINHAGLLFRIWLKTQPLQQWLVAREFRRRLVLAMQEKGIEIGTPQQLVQYVQATNPGGVILDENQDADSQPTPASARVQAAKPLH
jgi:moderate conductance mechanosensitive channel